MGRKKSKSEPRKPSRLRAWWTNLDSDRRRGAMLAVLWAAVTAGGLSAIGYGLVRLERYVLAHNARRVAPVVRVVLVEPPSWLPRQAVRRIEADLLPAGALYNDSDLTQRVYDLARRDPWIRSLEPVAKYLAAGGQVGVVEVRASYRQAIAQVQPARLSAARYVDEEGVVLPSSEVPQWVALRPDSAGRLVREGYYCSQQAIPPELQAAPIHYMCIQGVRAPAVTAGQKWGGHDLADAIRLVKLVFTERYASQINIIDVSNHDGRLRPHESEMLLYAQGPGGPVTEIRFGRFPRGGGGDHVVSPERKKAYLDQYALDNDGQIAGRTVWLDLRHDELRYLAVR